MKTKDNYLYVPFPVKLFYFFENSYKISVYIPLVSFVVFLLQLCFSCCLLDLGKLKTSEIKVQRDFFLFCFCLSILTCDISDFFSGAHSSFSLQVVNSIQCNQLFAWHVNFFFFLRRVAGINLNFITIDAAVSVHLSNCY